MASPQTTPRSPESHSVGQERQSSSRLWELQTQIYVTDETGLLEGGRWHSLRPQSWLVVSGVNLEFRKASLSRLVSAVWCRGPHLCPEDSESH